MKRKAVIFFLTAGFCIISFVNVWAAETILRIEGSEKMTRFVGPWADKFQQENPDMAIIINEGREKTGFADLIGGSCDIFMSSSGLKEEDRVKAKAQKIDILETVVASEGVIIAVNPQNPVNRLTRSQLKDILTGKVINWQEVGGEYVEIIVYNSASSPAVDNFVKKQIINQPAVDLQTEITYRAINLSSNDQVRQQIASQPGALGYYSGIYTPNNIKAIAIGLDESSEYIYPVKEKVPNELYPYRRPLFFWSKKEPAAVVKRFLDGLLSNEYQKMLAAYGFYPAKNNN